MPRNDLQNSKAGDTIARDYRLGGMKQPGSGEEVVDTVSQIDGVNDARIDENNRRLTLDFDPERVSEDHLVSTLNSLGHSILSPDTTTALSEEGQVPSGRDDVSGV